MPALNAFIVQVREWLLIRPSENSPRVHGSRASHYVVASNKQLSESKVEWDADMKLAVMSDTEGKPVAIGSHFQHSAGFPGKKGTCVRAPKRGKNLFNQETHGSKSPGSSNWIIPLGLKGPTLESFR